MIELDRVSVRYPAASVDAVRDVSLVANQGLTALVGPNGSGKSTLVRALLGVVPVSSGAVRLAGVDLRAYAAPERARRLAVVLQREEPAFPLRVRDYVALGRAPFHALWTSESAFDRAVVDEALARAEVEGLATRLTDTLSGGEWQRVRLARALAQHTPIIVFDEPTTFLDVAHEMACFETLAALGHAGKTVLVVSHQLNLVARFASTIHLLSAGRLAASGSPNEIMRADVLENVYQWPLVVTRDPAVGAPALLPLRRPH